MRAIVLNTARDRTCFLPVFKPCVMHFYFGSAHLILDISHTHCRRSARGCLYRRNQEPRYRLHRSHRSERTRKWQKQPTYLFLELTSMNIRLVRLTFTRSIHLPLQLIMSHVSPFGWLVPKTCKSTQFGVDAYLSVDLAVGLWIAR